MKIETEFVKKVKDFIIKNCLVDKGDKILVCLSGGADSVCLLRVMCALKFELGFEVYAAHVNHQIRGGDADRDEAFCVSLCKKFDVELYTHKKDVVSLSKQWHTSLEAAARKVRYDYFFELASLIGANKIATAHNQNDNAETSLMYYLRGSGVDGIKGILPLRSDGVIRPFLCASRKEIEEYLSYINQDFVTDKTNEEQIYMRNKIRLSLIPELCENYNSNIVEVLSENAILTAIDAKYLNEEALKRYEFLVKDSTDGVCISVEDYNKEPKALSLRILRFVIASLKGSDKDISYDTIMRCEALFGESKTSKKVSITDKLFAWRDYDMVYFGKYSDGKDYCYLADIGQKMYIEECDMSIDLSLIDKVSTIEENCEYFDYNLLCGQIYIRNRKNGDKFIPFNMKGTKKLKDFFIDEKIGVLERRKVPLITCEEEILLVCGKRRSNLYRVDENTTKVLRIEITEGK